MCQRVCLCTRVWSANSLEVEDVGVAADVCKGLRHEALILRCCKVCQLGGLQGQASVALVTLAPWPAWHSRAAKLSRLTWITLNAVPARRTRGTRRAGGTYRAVGTLVSFHAVETGNTLSSRVSLQAREANLSCRKEQIMLNLRHEIINC